MFWFIYVSTFWGSESEPWRPVISYNGWILVAVRLVLYSANYKCREEGYNSGHKSDFLSSQRFSTSMVTYEQLSFCEHKIGFNEFGELSHICHRSTCKMNVELSYIFTGRNSVGGASNWNYEVTAEKTRDFLHLGSPLIRGQLCIYQSKRWPIKAGSTA